MRVLVIAPRFPAINQPWIDTYLEHLQLNGIDFGICTTNAGNETYHKKVDQLSLRSHIVDYYPHQTSMFVRFLIGAITRPKRLAAKMGKSWRLAKIFAEYGSTRTVSFVKLFQSGVIGEHYGDFDVCHSHGETIAYEFLHYAVMFDIPLLMTFHGLPPAGVRQLDPEKRKLLYDRVAKVFVNTSFAKQQVCAVGCDARNVVILPQGLPVDEFQYCEDVFGGDKIVNILTVGRFHRDKGYGYALLAMRRLLNQGVLFHYHMVGVGPDIIRLTKLIEYLGLAARVTVHSAISDTQLKNLYSSCQLFVLPSVSSKHDEHVETQGVVLQEAQASGCIPIATRVGGIPECLNHEKDALLVRDRSSRAIAGAICNLIENSGNWYKYQRNGRRNVEQNFSAVVIGKKMATALRCQTAN